MNGKKKNVKMQLNVKSKIVNTRQRNGGVIVVFKLILNVKWK